jgi:NADP-dependent 3-hydroxy acid dehydrogenase YdfG
MNDMTRIASECVFLTGASAGFGVAIARRLAADGARLILVARRKERLDELAAELDTPCHVFPCDMRDRDALIEGIANLPDEFADVTCVINNAGLALGLEKAQGADLDDWETMVDTNIKGVLYATRALLPGMIERGRGYVIQLGSVAGNWPYPGGHVYCGTKAFVRQFSLAMRSDLLGTPVRVTNIEPGMAESEFSKVRFKGDSDRAASVYEGIEALQPEDIANTIAWCLEQPEHVNINSIELMATQQAFGGFATHRD